MLKTSNTRLIIWRTPFCSFGFHAKQPDILRSSIYVSWWWGEAEEGTAGRQYANAVIFLLRWKGSKRERRGSGAIVYFLIIYSLAFLCSFFVCSSFYSSTIIMLLDDSRVSCHTVLRTTWYIFLLFQRLACTVLLAVGYDWLLFVTVLKYVVVDVLLYDYFPRMAAWLPICARVFSFLSSYFWCPHFSHSLFWVGAVAFVCRARCDWWSLIHDDAVLCSLCSLLLVRIKKWCKSIRCWGTPNKRIVLLTVAVVEHSILSAADITPTTYSTSSSTRISATSPHEWCGCWVASDSPQSASTDVVARG